MSGILILLGSNLGERVENLSIALDALEEEAITVRKLSSIYETAPWGIENQPWFLNLVAEVSTTLLPKELLDCCQQIENQMGRVRGANRWGERLIDIDILYYQDLILKDPTLTIPHKEIPNRRFTLLPLAEGWPLMEHPSLNKTNRALLAMTQDTAACRKTAIRIR